MVRKGHGVMGYGCTAGVRKGHGDMGYGCTAGVRNAMGSWIMAV